MQLARQKRFGSSQSVKLITAKVNQMIPTQGGNVPQKFRKYLALLLVILRAERNELLLTMINGQSAN
jgi:hypothetical protein